VVFRFYNILVLILLTFNIGFAQNEANIWYFGNNAGLDFNSGSPVALTDGQMATQEGCASIADASGSLLFYTDGQSVWNRNHAVMQNGTGLNGSFSSSQSAIIVPKPGNSDMYFIFTVDFQGQAEGLQYSEVDMTLDSGLGGITTNKNILLVTPVLEKLTAVKHANGNDIWVIAHKNGSAEFYAYLVTSAGVSTTPVITDIGFSYSGPFFDENAGYMKVSPDGNKLVMAIFKLTNNIQLFDFDNSTGILSNHINVIQAIGLGRPYGVEFSASGDILYVSGTTGIAQFDISQGDYFSIQLSRTFLSGSLPNSDWGALQLGPDGKIYATRRSINEAPDINALSVINNPDLLGASCDFQLDAIPLLSGVAQVGLPQFIQSFFQVGFTVDNVCDGNAAQFNANITQAYDSISWDFGDGNFSTEENPSHTYANAGDYEVNLTVTSGTESAFSTKTVTIYELPQVASTVELRQCDDDTDGFSKFNLNQALEAISSNYPNETITFYSLETDATNASNPILNVNAYENQNPSFDTVWARVENANACFEIVQLNLIVTTTQIPDTFERFFYICDDPSNDGIGTFDFSSVHLEIVNMFPVGQDLIIQYFETIDDALSEQNAIEDISTFQNLNSLSSQDIYIRVDSAIDNSCLGLGQHITLVVEPLPQANAVIIEEKCDADGDGLFEFDTSLIEQELLVGQTNVIVSYFDETGLLIGNTLPNPFVTGNANITARVANLNSQNPEGPCYDETAIEFKVQAAAIANPIADFIGCVPANEAFAFDTSNIEQLLLNGQTGMVITYFDEAGNMLPSPLPNPFITASETVFVRVENALSASCFDETTINFLVYETPIAHQISDVFICDDESNDGDHVFNLSQFDAQLLNGQSTTNFEVLYFDNETDALNNTNALQYDYLVTNGQQIIYARVHNINNNSCFNITSFTIGVDALPIATQPDDIVICDDDSNDGTVLIDLSVQNSAILNGQNPVDFNITYHLNFEDAATNQNQLNNQFSNSQNPQTIYARIENELNGTCYDITSFDIYIIEKPVLEMSLQWSICEGQTVEIIADSGYDSYLWSTGETTQSIIVSEAGNYELVVSNQFEDIVCETLINLTVLESDIATITNISINDWSFNNNSVTVEITGNGSYQFSLDGFLYQDSNAFFNVPADEYTVYVRDEKGCGIATQNIYLVDYPRFFTPNNDGYNDYWHVINVDKEPNNIVHIFDRYGKLLKVLKSNEIGWDGSFNGNLLPTNDYWFVLYRENGKTYRGNFTLKR
jgi:gliding motility-associated-like protein